MKRNLLLPAALAACFLAPAWAAGLEDVKTVYLMPMSNGLDQYLAIQLTTGSVLQVVTDPQKADAVLTDHLGANFESSLNDLYGSKPKESESQDPGTAFTRVQSSQRGRGAMFLVNRKTRDVVWSTYESPKGSSPDTMKSAAGRIAGKLAKAIKGK